jgi:hypothetical protein
MANWNQPFSQPVLSIPLMGGIGCFFSGIRGNVTFYGFINAAPPKKVKYNHRLNTTLFRWW